MCRGLGGAGAAPLNTQRPHSSEWQAGAVACAIMCSTDAVRATDRDAAKRDSRLPTPLRAALVESS